MLTLLAYKRAYKMRFKTMTRIRFTKDRIEKFPLPVGKTQEFYWAEDPRHLAVRVSAGGKKSFIFQSRFRGKALRITIGSVTDWTVAQAQEKARSLQCMLDDDIDPRKVRQQKREQELLIEQQERANQLVVAEAWTDYIQQRTPHWSELQLRDHLSLAQAGGERRSRSKEKYTIPGPLFSLMGMKLKDLNDDHVLEWARQEAQTRPGRTRLGIRLLKAFLRWCASEPNYRDIVHVNAASSGRLRDVLGKPERKTTLLEKGQLTSWFKEVLQLPNAVLSAYLQILLLTGARRNELASLIWEDVDFRWQKICLRDKVEDMREIPLTPYVAMLLKGLPRASDWVFYSERSASGKLVSPNIVHDALCEKIGLPRITLQGLRRSFATLSDWVDLPQGVVAQIMGHKPSATAEKYYKFRSVDILRRHHIRFERWIIEQAELDYPIKKTLVTSQPLAESAHDSVGM